ncbi:hypothetical protein C2845_PM09G00260 [Panicum miliaceum]|uniref:DUF1618 domain-containing protein n=1 Tax=Panicum miliaceum TaxID=4540 RepID=A0A3L6S016_PANMI|nr:hypothetical protein C2845_PM09G00260 [Panicum miliaceum]
MAFSKGMMKLNKASLHPPALLDAGDDEEEIPWVLLEYKAYVADRRNDTTAVAYSRCGREIQVSFFAARPPRVSHLCVFCRPAATSEEEEEEEEEEEMIAMEPQVLATDENLVLLRIIVSAERDIISGNDLYVYRPAGDGGPSLELLRRRPRGRRIVFNSCQVGILSCRDVHQESSSKFYTVAALDDDESARGRGRFVLYLYNSKLQTWTSTNASVEDQHFHKYQDQGYFLHFNTRVIAVGGEGATIAFVDLWRGILLLDLAHVTKDGKPCSLRYVPLPGRPSSALRSADGDACLSRDISVVDGHFKFVRRRRQAKDCRCPTCGRDERIQDGCDAAVWTRPVSASSLLDDSWQPVCDMETSGMDINRGGDKAWVIAVDMMNNRLQGVAEFDAQRSVAIGFAYLHTGISKYLNKKHGSGRPA